MTRTISALAFHSCFQHSAICGRSNARIFGDTTGATRAVDAAAALSLEEA